MIGFALIRISFMIPVFFGGGEGETHPLTNVEKLGWLTKWVFPVNLFSNVWHVWVIPKKEQEE